LERCITFGLRIGIYVIATNGIGLVCGNIEAKKKKASHRQHQRTAKKVHKNETEGVRQKLLESRCVKNREQH